MTTHDTLKHHAELFDRMACAVGLDLEEQAVSGAFQFEEIAEAVLRCRRCGNIRGCETWLSAASIPDRAADPADAAPDFCRNRDLLAYLREAPEE